MIEIILSVLVDFGLIREDYKHRKLISKKEKEDGRKRTVQKYLFQPSSIVTIILIVLFSCSAFLFVSYQTNSMFPKKTSKELAEIHIRMEKWKEKFGYYPLSLEELIGNGPIRQEWNNDAWHRPYKYSVSEDGSTYLILSAGADGQFETEDDVK
ncbi:type II secretion system protein GspG [Maribacter sp. Asnod1-A12]|uniref:type II secretion system protein GspG n=1 Tax=Maribacter sp. Asnod1-A12 TaxID=3160576 RepID=UPI00386F6E23